MEYGPLKYFVNRQNENLFATNQNSKVMALSK